MYQLIQRLYPICRSITGNGLRQTLHLLQEAIPLTVHEVPSGTQVFDWAVPPEWNIKDAYVKNARGEKVIDFKKLNLHVINYSVPVKKKVSLSELKEHLVTLPDHPDWIPYRTTYYKRTWGFCLSHRQLLELEEGEYEVCIDSSLEDGHLSYGELFIEGQMPDEVLFSCHVCHPSLCNDNLSSIAVAAFLAKYLRSRSLRYSYRFLFIPGTIGSITWLFRNEMRTSLIKHGLVLSCLGDAGQFTYKKSRRGDVEIDRVVEFVLQQSGNKYTTVDFSPYGYDERQFCSPGFNLPIGCLMRTPNGCFPEYHTSADNLEFVGSEFLAESFSQCLAIVNVLENNKKYVNQNPKCEPQLGKRGLYGALGGAVNGRMHELAMLWVLNYSDGRYSLLDIAVQSGLKFDIVQRAANLLVQHDLLKEE
jgi:aminopeptidase-like protein